ncbi:MAG: hypothetical protein ACRC0F_03695 [Cetobacterium sp.]
MDNVILLKKHLSNFSYSYFKDGYYENGIYVQGEEITENFKACIFPINGNTLKLFPEGTLNSDDKLLYTKANLENVIDYIKLFDKDVKYRIFRKIDFTGLADLNTYLVRRIGSNG